VCSEIEGKIAAFSTAPGGRMALHLRDAVYVQARRDGRVVSVAVIAYA
jgi:transposase-like protein